MTEKKERHGKKTVKLNNTQIFGFALFQFQYMLYLIFWKLQNN